MSETDDVEDDVGVEDLPRRWHDQADRTAHPVFAAALRQCASQLNRSLRLAEETDAER